MLLPGPGRRQSHSVPGPSLHSSVSSPTTQSGREGSYDRRTVPRTRRDSGHRPHRRGCPDAPRHLTLGTGCQSRVCPEGPLERAHRLSRRRRGTVERSPGKDRGGPFSTGVGGKGHSSNSDSTPVLPGRDPTPRGTPTPWSEEGPGPPRGQIPVLGPHDEVGEAGSSWFSGGDRFLVDPLPGRGGEGYPRDLGPTETQQSTVNSVRSEPPPTAFSRVSPYFHHRGLRSVERECRREPSRVLRGPGYRQGIGLFVAQ